MTVAPAIAHAQQHEIVYQGLVNNQTYCIWGSPSFDPVNGIASASVYTDGNCGAFDYRVLIPFTSREVSVYPIAWYSDGQGSYIQCQVGAEIKVSNAYSLTKNTQVTACPHQRWISVWAHVAARPTSTWYGGDVYGQPVWYP
jgi:hypothetical protein